MVAMKGLLPWLTVLAVVFLLSIFRLRALATVVAAGWLIYAGYTWLRAARASR